jgi:hypothetical protein
MIQLSDNVRLILSEPTVRMFTMVSVGDYKVTDYFNSITLNNGDYFLSDGRLLGIDPPAMTTSVDRQQYKISFADDDNFFGAMFEEVGYSGLPTFVRVGLLDPYSGLPRTDVNDTIMIYKGRMDNGGYSFNTESVGDATFTVNCTSPMGALDLIKTFYTTKDAYLNSYPEDTSFSQVYEGSGQITLKWGKG